MSTRAQRTLASEVELEGVGLFTAAPVRVLLKPAGEDQGIVFVRTDTGTPVRIPASIDHLAPADHRTALACDGTRLETVEHCLAALFGTGIDNAIIEVHGPELPIGDGSCLLFTDPIRRVGAREQGAMRREITIDKPYTITCERTGARLSATPPDEDHPALRATYALDYGDNAPIAAHEATFDFETDDFCTALAPSRTFSTKDEAEGARAIGLFTHLTPRDMLVIDHDGPIDNRLRTDDEPARHKIIDMIGDLALAGAPVRGRIVGTRSGHAMNHDLARLLASL